MSTRGLPALPGFALALLLFLAIAPVVLAADPTVAPGPATVEVDLGTEPLLPYIAALLVTSVALMIVGFLAMRVYRRPPAGAARRDPGAWWPCRDCATSNTGDRETCFACTAPRTPPGA